MISTTSPRGKTRDYIPLVWWWAITSTETSIAAVAAIQAIDSSAAVDPLSVILLSFLWLGGALSPVIVAVKGCVIGGLVWAILEVTGSALRYARCVTAVLMGEAVLTLGLLIPAAVALLTDIDLAIVTKPVGLTALVEPDSATLALIVGSLNIYLAGSLLVLYLCLQSYDVIDNSQQNSRAPRARLLAVLGAGAAQVVIPALVLSM